MRIRIAMVAALLVGSFAQAEERALNFGEWDRLLKKYTDAEGRVDYWRLKGDAADVRALEGLAAQIAAARPEELPSERAREAFYLDAYNVLVWKNVIDRLPGMKQVDESLYKFFRIDFTVAGKPMDLDDLEKKVIRPRFKDPRVHMALNCASGGCPRLPREAFTPDQLEEQLEREARRFCNEPRNVSWDPATRTVTLSKLFDWYEKDFSPSVIEWINRYREAGGRIHDARVKFADYDWRLNDPSLRR